MAIRAPSELKKKGYNYTWPSCSKLTSSSSPGHLEITVHLFDCSGKVIEENLRSIYKLIHLESCKCMRRGAIFEFVREKIYIFGVTRRSRSDVCQ